MPDPPPPSRDRWLLLLQQLPTRPSSVRIRTWRRLQQIGSVVLKNSAYVLPHTAEAREDFEWLAGEIRASGGQASILIAEALTARQDADIKETFRSARAADYEALKLRARELARATARRPTGAGRHKLHRAVRALREELLRIAAIDFFGTPARTATEEAIDALAARLNLPDAAKDGLPVPVLSRAAYQRRTWATRPRPGIDRMACAWLIREFIDPRARFVFAESEDAARAPKGSIAFDMFGAEFGHQGDRCSFETLCHRFGIDDPAVRRIAGIVHDVDLKDQKYGAVEAATIGSVVDGLQATHADDAELLQHGMAVFAGLYSSFRAAATRPRVRPPRATRSRNR